MRETLAPLLLRRFQLINPPVLVGTAAFAILHVTLGEKQLGVLLGFKALQATVSAAGLWISRRRPSRRVIVTCLLALSVTLNAVTALTGMIIGNVHTNALLFVATTLATSSFLPWGPKIQAASVVGATFAALAPLTSGRPVYHDIWYDLVALGIAFLLSIYIAREVENDTLAEYRARAATRALAESRADVEAVFRSSNVLLALLELSDDDFFYAEANDTLAGLFGLTCRTMKGKHGRELGFPPEEIAAWRAICQRCAVEGSLHIPEYRLDVITPPRWYHISLSAIDDELGGPVRLSGVGVDITELKRATEDISHLNLDLEAQVHDRTALLEAANKDLESFAYSVSHDLRTPLRSIEGFAALLGHDHASELSPSAMIHLDRIRSASRHMAHLIDDMLMLSRASLAEIRRERVDVTRLALSVCAEIRAANPETKATVSVTESMVTQADPNLLRLVLANLLGNAWKYAGRREAPRIEVGSETRDGEVAFFVRDNGCGFDMRFVAKLFQPFQRLHAAEDYEGTGVGLATVARIVRRHGGRVWADGKVDEGATFRFSIGDGSATGAG